MFTTTLLSYILSREQDLKLEICYSSLVKTYDNSEAYCALRRRGA